MTSRIPPELIDDLEDVDVENTSSVAGDNVQEALDNAGVPSTFGGIGTYVLATHSSGVIASGATVTGATLTPIAFDVSSSTESFGSTLSGTWRNMGGPTGTGASNQTSLWLRLS